MRQHGCEFALTLQAFRFHLQTLFGFLELSRQQLQMIGLNAIKNPAGQNNNCQELWKPREDVFDEQISGQFVRKRTHCAAKLKRQQLQNHTGQQ